MRVICFELTMPRRNTWNGRWSGEEKTYTRTRRFNSTKKAGELVTRILAQGSYYYDFGDGWAASVRVREVTPQEARKIDKASGGFWGYEWMIDSIINDGKIIADHQRKAVAHDPSSTSGNPSDSA